MTIDVVTVADNARISLCLALNILVSKKVAPDCRFHAAVPADSNFGSDLAKEVIESNAESIYQIPSPNMMIEGRLYRIQNKINSVRFFGPRPSILVDSDLLFIKPLPKEFLLRKVPAAVPEHGKHDFPWKRLYETIGLTEPQTLVLTGSGATSLPWFNAGLVTSPNSEQLGEAWRMITQYVIEAPWVPTRWPYADQIALPLAMAQLSDSRTANYDNVLPSTFNQNMFYWSKTNGQVASGYVCHHHGRVGLLREHLGQLLSWVDKEYSQISEILEELSKFDENQVGARENNKGEHVD